MELIKTLWASVQRDPKVMRRLNGWLTVFWIAMIPISAWRGWLSSVAYVSALSLWALVSGHWAAWQAAHESRSLRMVRSARASGATGATGATGARDAQPAPDLSPV